MLYNICFLFLLFFVYSLIGYIAEVIWVSICLKKFTFSRGFLIGPYIPIYGAGMICVTKLLSKYQDDLLVLFVMSIVLCTILEYLTSLVMEKAFKLRWWDYSDQRFNVNGRVCLTNSVLFGFAGLFVMKIINPTIENMLLSIPNFLTIILALIFAVVIITDTIVSIVAVYNIKIDVKKYTRQDATEAIKKEVSEALKKHQFLVGRIFTAFPNINQRKNIDFSNYKELVIKTKEEVKKLKKEYKNRKNANKKKTTKGNI